MTPDECFLRKLFARPARLLVARGAAASSSSLPRRGEDRRIVKKEKKHNNKLDGSYTTVDSSKFREHE